MFWAVSHANKLHEYKENMRHPQSWFVLPAALWRTVRQCFDPLRVWAGDECYHGMLIIPKTDWVVLLLRGHGTDLMVGFVLALDCTNWRIGCAATIHDLCVGQRYRHCHVYDRPTGGRREGSVVWVRTCWSRALLGWWTGRASSPGQAFRHYQRLFIRPSAER